MDLQNIASFSSYIAIGFVYLECLCNLFRIVRRKLVHGVLLLFNSALERYIAIGSALGCFMRPLNFGILFSNDHG